MFARDWRGVASAPANVVADPVRCVSNTAGAADDGSGVVAIVGKDKVGRLKKALYGLRDAPQIWKWHLAKTMREIGFNESSNPFPCVARGTGKPRSGRDGCKKRQSV